MKKYLILFAILSALVACKQNASALTSNAQLTAGSQSSVQALNDNVALEQAFKDKKSNIFVEGNGVVKKLLPDDNKGSRHQKFLVTISDEQILLFAHNIDLAKPVPIAVGDTVQFRGEYVYNPKGGVVHWTHHDPQANIEGGWIKHNGQIYQ